MEKTQNTKEEIKKAFQGIDRAALATALEVDNRTYIDQIAGGHVQVSAKRAKEIEKLTLGRVKAKVLRPDIFGS